MRILLDYRPALRQRTGVGEYVHELASAILDTQPAGESLVLFSSSWKDRMPAWTPAPTSGRRGLPEQRDLKIPVRVLNYAWHRLGWPPIERLARSIDVAHSLHPLLIPTRRAAQIVTVHDLDFLDNPERTRAEIRRDYPALAAAHAQRADRVVVVSRHTASEVQRRLGVDSSRISICSPGRPDWPRRLAEPPDGPILFLGTLEPRKNLGVLLDAYERLIARRPTAPNLVLAGGTTEASGPIVEQASRQPLAGRVELTGYVDPLRRQEQYRRALLFVLPSHAEGFGIPALEAMTCGVPVVAANRGALPEVVGPAGKLFDPDDPEALTSALETLLADAPLRNRMREDGWAQASRFDWRESAHRAREAWTLAIEARNRRRATGRTH